jgi:hypothetical protein
MFISPELFHFRSDDTPELHDTPFYMDEESQRHKQSGSVLGKRSRTDDHHHAPTYVLASSLLHYSPLTFSSPRKTRTALTIKLSERDNHESFLRDLLPSSYDQETFVVSQDADLITARQPLQRHATYPSAKARRRIAPTKKPKSPNKTSCITPIADAVQTPVLLTPCHICHKAPRLKKDLEAYADCRTCEERTCYICIRQCEVANCGRKVCRQCCVEQGENGDVYCLDCLEKTQDHEMED